MPVSLRLCGCEHLFVRTAANYFALSSGEPMRVTAGGGLDSPRL
jgi:hypothetical protein